MTKGPTPIDDIIAGLEKYANIELVLKVNRSSVGDGFVDTLSLDISDAIKSEPNRYNITKGMLRLAGYDGFNAQLYYFPAERVLDNECNKYFFKMHNGKAYATGMDDIARLAVKLYAAVEGIKSHPLSPFKIAPVEGLEYIEHTVTRMHGNNYGLLENAIPKKESPPNKEMPHISTWLKQDEHKN